MQSAARSKAEPFPPFMLEIINAGGLIAKVRADVAAGRAPRRQG